MEEMKKKGNVIALLPIGVFLVLYLGLGILFEYVMEIPMGFYNVPIVVAFLVAILVACVQNSMISLLCFCGDGNLRWDYHASYPYCGSGFQSLRF